MCWCINSISSVMNNKSHFVTAIMGRERLEKEKQVGGGEGRGEYSGEGNEEGQGGGIIVGYSNYKVYALLSTHVLKSEAAYSQIFQHEYHYCNISKIWYNLIVKQN